MWPPTCTQYIAMFLNSSHFIKTLHITLNKDSKNTMIDLLKAFSDPQITQELMQLNNSFWGKTEFSCWKQEAMNELRTIMNAITVQYKATTSTSPCKHCTVHILWRKMANGYPDANVTNIILLPVKILAKNMNKAITESSSLTNTNKLIVYNMLQVFNDLTAKGNLFIPKLSSKTEQIYFQYRGVHAWNSLSVDPRDYSLEQL